MPLELDIEFEPETFQDEPTNAQRQDIEMKGEPKELDEVAVKAEPRNGKNETSEKEEEPDDNSYGQLEYDIKLEPYRFNNQPQMGPEVRRSRLSEIEIKAESRDEKNETSEKEEEPDDESNGQLEYDIKLEPYRFNNQPQMGPVVRLTRLSEIEIKQLTTRKKKMKATSKVEAVKRGQKIPKKSPLVLNHKGPHICDLCGTICKIRRSMHHHMRYRHLTAPRFFCDLCPKFFKTKGNLANHMKTNIKFKSHACDVCEFKTNRKDALQIHKLTHGKKTECALCNRLVNVMKKHMQTVHKKVPCKICGKKVSKDDLRRHVRRLHEKNNPCTHDNCNEAFGTKLELNRHKLRAHSKGKVFECHCGAVFKTRQCLSKHKYNTHKSGVQTCKICDLKYKSQDALRQHWNKKHSEAYGRFEAAQLH